MPTGETKAFRVEDLWTCDVVECGQGNQCFTESCIQVKTKYPASSSWNLLIQPVVQHSSVSLALVGAERSSCYPNTKLKAPVQLLLAPLSHLGTQLGSSLCLLASANSIPCGLCLWTFVHSSGLVCSPTALRGLHDASTRTE